MTFMEVIIMIAIIAVIMATGMKANQNVQFREKFENTIVEMQMLKRAIVGNKNPLLLISTLHVRVLVTPYFWNLQYFPPAPLDPELEVEGPEGPHDLVWR